MLRSPLLARGAPRSNSRRCRRCRPRSRSANSEPPLLLRRSRAPGPQSAFEKQGESAAPAPAGAHARERLASLDGDLTGRAVIDWGLRRARAARAAALAVCRQAAGATALAAVARATSPCGAPSAPPSPPAPVAPAPPDGAPRSTSLIVTSLASAWLHLGAARLSIVRHAIDDTTLLAVCRAGSTLTLTRTVLLDRPLTGEVSEPAVVRGALGVPCRSPSRTARRRRPQRAAAHP